MASIPVELKQVYDNLLSCLSHFSRKGGGRVVQGGVEVSIAMVLVVVVTVAVWVLLLLLRLLCLLGMTSLPLGLHLGLDLGFQPVIVVIFCPLVFLHHHGL